MAETQDQLANEFLKIVHALDVTEWIIGVGVAIAMFSMAAIAVGASEEVIDLTFWSGMVTAGTGYLYDQLRSWVYKRGERDKLRLTIDRAALDDDPLRRHGQSAVGLLEFVTAQINGMAAREKMTMLQAERDANRLVAVGMLLTVVSVFAPIAAAYLYIQMEPLPASTVAGLVKLRAELGAAPGFEQLTLARDWHVLAGGLSFGFLFLAAARSALGLESRKRATALMLSRRVNHFERLVGVLHARARVATEPDKMLAQVVSDVLTAAETPPDIEKADGLPDEPTNAMKEHLTAIADLFKKQGTKAGSSS